MHTMKHLRISLTKLTLGVGVAFALSTACPSVARADVTMPAGEQGQLAIDTLVGMRLSIQNGFGYVGPVGFAVQRYSEDRLQATGTGTVTDTTSVRTFWLAPAADYFIIDRLSLGGVVELINVATSVESKGGPITTNADLPSTWSFTLLPRVGYLIPLGERFAIWPRGGIGYFNRQTVSAAANNSSKSTFSAVGTQIQVPFMFRITDTFFFHASPDFVVTFGGSREITNNANVSVSNDASALQFGVFTGLGALIDL